MGKNIHVVHDGEQWKVKQEMLCEVLVISKLSVKQLIVHAKLLKTKVKK